MEPIKKFGPFSSSIDPEKLGTTVQAATRVISGMLVFGGVLTLGDQTTLLAQVPQIVNAGLAIVPLAYSIWNAGEVIFGILRKVVAAVGKMLAARKVA